ncbi:MAG TPA: hypothetical protein VMF91_16605 [Bryobacteraceae bacterium]|nr:hypothetical protein [Bryobacteraceae bacterium]
MATSDSPALIDSTEEEQLKTNPDKPVPKESRRSERFRPLALAALEDTGVPSALIEQLILKFLYFKGDLLASDLCRFMGLRFSLIERMIEDLKLQRHLQVKSSRGYGPVSAVLSLTEGGRGVTRDYLENNQYVGPVPVPIAQYTAAVYAQRTPSDWLTRERLAAAYSKLVVSDAMLDQIGPAVGSGKSFLIYGQPGNGKTQIAEALANISTTDIYIPYAIEAQGNIVQLFDPIYHKATGGDNEAANHHEIDGRWARCKRPFIATGGELSLDMLDLNFNRVSRIYDAPFQLKANNGIYLIDDFGRQKATSAEILNRWIIPMERRIDYLSFENGGKMTVPFETFPVFSTNLTPDQLGDEAFLRRIQYKMLVRSPDEQEFREIFHKFAESQGLDVRTELLDRFIYRHYTTTGKKFRRCHPRDLISQCVDYIHFKRLPFELTDELMDLAFASCFAVLTESSET